MSKNLGASRDPYFSWPSAQDWPLDSCAGGDRHLRRPASVGTKDPGAIRSLVIGLNPGLREWARKEFFVGRSGQYLRDHYDDLWSAASPPAEVLVTNIIKLVTRNQAELEAIPTDQLNGCVRNCFLAELTNLPAVTTVYVLGERTSDLFEQILLSEGNWPHLTIHRLPHPSWFLRRGLESVPEDPKLPEHLQRKASKG